MKRTNSICSYSRLLSSLIVLTIALPACQKSSEKDATGKGNGGNQLSLNKAQVEEMFADIKPKLTLVFEGLADLVKAEKKAEGSTEISDKALLATLELMFTPKDETKSALKDLETEDNLDLQEEPCVDFRGVPNAAAAVAGEIGGKICFSNSKIRNASIKNLENAAEIFLIALATHEFVHHYLNSDDTEAEELAARAVQNFVEQQLAKNLEDDKGEMISTDGDKYLQRFRERAQEILELAGETR